MDRNVIIGHATKASDQNYNINFVDNVNYTILDNDKYDEIWVDPSSAHKIIYFPIAANNVGRKIKVINNGDGSYKITLSPNGSDKFIVYSGNEKWELTSFELLQAGDWCEYISDETNWIKCNSPYWHLFSDPATGDYATKTSTWNTDNFDTGWTVTFSQTAIGTLAIRCSMTQADTTGTIYYRKNGDPNISNTPDSNGEKANRIFESSDKSLQIPVLWLSSDSIVQFAATNVAADLYIRSPIGYLQ